MSCVQHTLLAMGMAFALPTFTFAAESPAATPGIAATLQSAPPSATGTSALSGTWRSAPEETPLSSAFDESVWGKNAVAVRTVQMVVTPKGDATLTVNRKVLDGRKRTVPGSASVEQVQMVLGPIQKSTDVRCDLTVAVKQAERRYPDDPGSTWPLEGLKVGVVTFTDNPGTVEIRVDTPEGRGSFWETLHRGTPKKSSTTH
jgi:hypothetical protein